MLFGDEVKAKIKQASVDLRFPDTIQFLLEGEGLPESAKFHKDSEVIELRPMYERISVSPELDTVNEVFKVKFLNWGK